MLSRQAKHLACDTQILRFAQNDIRHLARNRAVVYSEQCLHFYMKP
jgi:hypothetical protein